MHQFSSNKTDEFALQEDDQDSVESPEIQDLAEAKITADIFSYRQGLDHSAQVVNIDKEKRLGSLFEKKYSLYLSMDAICSGCGYTGVKNGPIYRRALLGAPFYIANAVPTVLEYCPDFEMPKGSNVGKNSLPANGRRLITFTDSRQGTARMSVRMQQEAERSKVRGAVFEVLKNKQLEQSVGASDNLELIEKLKKEISELEPLVGSSSVIEGMVNDKRSELNKLCSQTFESVSLSWDEMKLALAIKNDFQGSMLLYNKYHLPETFDDSTGAIKLADLLLIREFSRRPKRVSSAETQGLVRVDYKNLDQVKSVPQHWEQHKLTLADWQDFIKVCLDFWVRERNFMRYEDEGWRKWVGSRLSTKTFVAPDPDGKNEYRVERWPQIKGNSLSRLAKLLVLGSKIDPTTNQGKDTINLWLKAAWLELTEKVRILSVDNNQYYLDRSKLAFTLLDSAYVCPITHKLIDTAFKGFTPYLPMKLELSADNSKFVCERVDLPSIWEMGDQQLQLQDS